jgi:LPS sulfotransferase NodH
MQDMERHRPGSVSVTAKRRVSYWSWEFRNYYQWFRARMEAARKTRFVLLCRGRSGSHLLMSMLEQHPLIHLDHERLVLHQPKFRVTFLKQYFEGLSTRGKTPVYGCKTHVQHVDKQGVDAVKFFHRLHKDGWMLIYLHRRDLLRQGISKAIARDRNTVFDTEKNPLREYKVRLDPQCLLTLIDNQQKDMERDAAVLSELPHLRLEYEADLSQPDRQQATLKRIFDYVGVDRVETKSGIQKTTPYDFRDIILNYDEVMQAVAASKYRYFLTQEELAAEYRRTA